MAVTFQRFELGPIELDTVDAHGAIDAIVGAGPLSEGYTVVTLNTHHLRLAWSDPEYAMLLRTASLSVADGWPLVAAGRLAGRDLRTRVTGSDLVPRLLEQRPWRLAILGGPPGTAEILGAQLDGHEVVLTDALPVGAWQTEEYMERLARELLEAGPELVLVGIGAPAQERLAAALAPTVPAVFIGCGATLEFMTGERPRAPRWMQRVGLEWAHRLMVDPRRLGPRYAMAALAVGRLVPSVARQRSRRR